MASAATSAIVRVSVSSTGEQSNGATLGVSISGTGRWVAFSSYASNLVPSDTNARSDIFVRDLDTNRTELVSVSSSGTHGNLGSYSPVISTNGRWIAFSSYANNLIPGDRNGEPDVFVHDLTTGTTEVVSISSSGEAGNNGSLLPSISGDGARVAFQSYASNLVAGDSNGVPDVFMRDRTTGNTELVSQSSSNHQGTARSGDSLAISGNGSTVAFQSTAHNLVPNDANRAIDIFVRHLDTGKTILASVSSSGGQGLGGSSTSPSLSPGGERVVFSSFANNLVANDTTGPESQDIFLHDLRDGTTQLASVNSSGEQGNGSSTLASIRRSLVLFQSGATNLVPNDTSTGRDIFVHNLNTGETEAIDVGPSGELGSFSFNPSMSGDGSRIAFASYDGALVPDDTNGFYDAFVRKASN
ncbi:MAG: hypothetical protein M3P01_11615 [Actinomycetota bacterium]|nr:hypothetical protein [Actinomycetota bacterium]